jgi:hypothetical protein
MPYSQNDMYKYKLMRAHVNILNKMYDRPVITTRPKPVENPRLCFRFKEAIKEAETICKEDAHSDECHLAWYEVDELEDSILRLYSYRK